MAQPLRDFGYKDDVGAFTVRRPHLLIEEWMTKAPRSVRPLDSVAHARALLEEHRINQLPVVTDGHLVGIVTDRDLRDATTVVKAATAEAGSVEAAETTPDRISVESVMTTNVLTLKPGDTLERAAELMRRERIGAVPIVEKGRLCGILTRSDILKAFVAMSGKTGGKSRRASTPQKS